MRKVVGLVCAVLLCASWPLLASRNGLSIEQAFSGAQASAYLEPHTSADTKRVLTFNRDVAPILFTHCSSCHRVGGSGPFPLLTYAEVKKHARQVAFVTQNREMPPWLPDAGQFRFQNDSRLGTDQIATIHDWIEQGEVEGNPEDLPTQPQFHEGWQLGRPDLILQPERPFALPAGGPDQYWNFVLHVPTKRTRWLKAMEVLSVDNRILHHAMLVLPPRNFVPGQEQSAVNGFPGMEFQSAGIKFFPETHLFFWQPGRSPYVYPDQLSMRLDKSADLILSVHLQPSGKPELVQPSVGLYFTKTPATEVPLVFLLENDTAIDIPPRAKLYLVSDSFTLPVDVDLLALYPHAHYLAEDLTASASFPDGDVKQLIHIRHWDLNWQSVYHYQSPVFLPKGTTISLRYIYNNSEGNVSNPNYPPKPVIAGEGIAAEMSHLWLQVLPRDLAGNSRGLLQRALENRRLQNKEQHPD